MMCYYLNVHFQGQRIKLAERLEASREGPFTVKLLVTLSLAKDFYFRKDRAMFLTGVHGGADERADCYSNRVLSVEM